VAFNEVAEGAAEIDANDFDFLFALKSFQETFKSLKASAFNDIEDFVAFLGRRRWWQSGVFADGMFVDAKDLGTLK